MTDLISQIRGESSGLTGEQRLIRRFDAIRRRNQGRSEARGGGDGGISRGEESDIAIVILRSRLRAKYGDKADDPNFFKTAQGKAELQEVKPYVREELFRRIREKQMSKIETPREEIKRVIDQSPRERPKESVVKSIATKGGYIQSQERQFLTQKADEFSALTPEEAEKRALRGDKGFQGTSSAEGNTITFNPNAFRGEARQAAEQRFKELPFIQRKVLTESEKGFGLAQLSIGAVETGTEFTLSGFSGGIPKENRTLTGLAFGKRGEVGFFDRGTLGEIKNKPISFEGQLFKTRVAVLGAAGGVAATAGGSGGFGGTAREVLGFTTPFPRQNLPQSGILLSRVESSELKPGLVFTEGQGFVSTSSARVGPATVDTAGTVDFKRQLVAGVQRQTVEAAVIEKGLPKFGYTAQVDVPFAGSFKGYSKSSRIIKLKTPLGEQKVGTASQFVGELDGVKYGKGVSGKIYKGDAFATPEQVFRSVEFPSSSGSDVRFIASGSRKSGPLTFEQTQQVTNIGAAASSPLKPPRIISKQTPNTNIAITSDAFSVLKQQPSAFVGTGLYEKTSLTASVVPKQGPPKIDFLTLGGIKADLGLNQGVKTRTIGYTQPQTTIKTDIFTEPKTGPKTTGQTGLITQNFIPQDYTPYESGLGTFNFRLPDFTGGRGGIGFGSLPVGQPRSTPKRKKTRQPLGRFPSLAAVEFGYTASSPSSLEVTGLVERPIIKRRKKRGSRNKR